MMMAELPLGLSMGMGSIDERPISMMMAELPLELFMILGRKAAPLAHLVKKTIDEQPISMMMAELPLGLSMRFGLQNSALEINHVMNMTTVLSETTASDRVSRCLTNVQHNLISIIICAVRIHNCMC